MIARSVGGALVGGCKESVSLIVLMLQRQGLFVKQFG